MHVIRGACYTRRVSPKDHIEVVPLGGVGEFGMNMMAVRFAGTIVVIDAGLMFPRDELLGVDLVIPDLTYLLENREEVRCVLLTHGHEDHIGALPYLLREIPVPVYGTPLTLGFVRGRLGEHGLLETADLTPVHSRNTLDVGSMHVEFLSVTHSIADSLALAITTEIGTIIHTGDFKFDQSPPDHKLSDYARLGDLGEQGVLALFSDSTNSERPGYTPSESLVRHHLEQVFHSSSRKIIVACFASSIHRIQIILELAREFGRKVVPIGRSMKENIAIASELGYLDIPAGVLTDAQEGQRLPDSELILLSTGSQGEPMAALSRLALGKFKDFTVEPGDSVVVSARVIPGNETRMSHLINHFCRRGARIFDEAQWTIHVSGHGSQEELKLMLNLTRPRFFTPIHGEYRQLYHHARVAEAAGIPKERIVMAQTGDIIALTPESAAIAGKAPVGRTFVDEGGVTAVDEAVVADRQHLSEEGIVLAVVPISKATGTIEGTLELVSRGYAQQEDSAAFLAQARQVLTKALEEATAEERTDALVLTEIIRTELKRYFKKRTGTRPMIVPVVLEI
jgi:ribonuclease J